VTSDRDDARGSAFYADILEHAPWGAIVASTAVEGTCEYMNAEFTRTTGYTLDDIPTVAAWVELAYPDPDYRREVMANWDDDVKPENMHRDVVYRVVCAGGETKEIQFRASPFGQQRMIVMLLDVTEARRAEDERTRLDARMHQKQKLESLGVLASGVAHDFNNLLVGILGNADLALMDLAPGTAAYAKVEAIKNTARRAADLAGQLHAYSGEESFSPERLDLRDAVDEIRSLLESSISKKARLRLDFDDYTPEVLADTRLLRQVLMNLVTNASEALEDAAGTITISTAARECAADDLGGMLVDDEVEPGLFGVLEVRDTGAGFEGEAATLFDPFSTNRLTGRGLGLATVLGIVRSHLGAVEALGNPGKGATFRILLPAFLPEPSEEELAAESLSTWIGRGTVLLVDDEFMVRDVARAMLERAGFDVLTAQDGYEAVEIFRDHGEDCCCVLVDLAMPRMNGEETFRELRRQDPDVRVVLSSGYDADEADSRFAGTGLAAFVRKPYTYAQLIDAVRRALGQL
jgi:PAS domain S-box-containing protein